MTKRQVITLLRKRARLAREFRTVCLKIDDYIIDNGLRDKVDDEVWGAGLEQLVNPEMSADAVIAIIEEELE